MSHTPMSGCLSLQSSHAANRRRSGENCGKINPETFKCSSVLGLRSSKVADQRIG
jgi:hypothetical protein